MRLLLCLLLLAAGCVRVQWTRDRRYEPILSERAATLVVDETDLGVCLAALGAPHFVSEANGGGMWLVWGWSDEIDWGFSVSYQVVRFVSPSFSWTSNVAGLSGLALRLDDDLVLRERREGKLSNIFTGGKDVNRRDRARPRD